MRIGATHFNFSSFGFGNFNSFNNFVTSTSVVVISVALRSFRIVGWGFDLSVAGFFEAQAVQRAPPVGIRISDTTWWVAIMMPSAGLPMMEIHEDSDQTWTPVVMLKPQ